MQPKELYELFRSKVESIGKKDANVFELPLKMTTNMALRDGKVEVVTLETPFPARKSSTIYYNADRISADVKKYFDMYFKYLNIGEYFPRPKSISISYSIELEEPHNPVESDANFSAVFNVHNDDDTYRSFPLATVWIPAKADKEEAAEIMGTLTDRFLLKPGFKTPGHYTPPYDEKAHIFLELRDIEPKKRGKIADDIRRIVCFYDEGQGCLPARITREFGGDLSGTQYDDICKTSISKKLGKIADMRLYECSFAPEVDGPVRLVFEGTHGNGRREVSNAGEKEFFAGGIAALASMIPDILEYYETDGIVTCMAVCCGEQQRALSFAADKNGFNLDTMIVDGNIEILKEQAAAREESGMRMDM